ncbi:MAG TPA: M56 family metallopeptidase [Thermoanaerobaculia bacterium]|nr:M56 family metallopeptidase [Thermoanaerobaculia bacterium]
MNAITIWGATYLLHSTLLITAVALLSRFVRSASVRDTLWKVALTGGLLTASLQLLPLRAARPSQVQITVASAAAVEIPVTPKTSAASRVNLTAATFGLYAVIALVLLARLVIGRRRFLSLVAGRRELLRGPERERLDSLAERARCRRAVRLTASRAVSSPVALAGFEIVIPAATFPHLRRDQQETVLAHELAHLLRRDPLWLTVAELMKTLLFIQPLHWLAAAKMRETAEFLCDDAAVLQTGNPRALAETLAELASQVSPRAAAAAAMAEHGSNLIVRVQRTLQTRASAPLRLRSRAAIAVLVLGTMSLFAPVFARAASGTATWDANFSRSTDDGTRLRAAIHLRYDQASGAIDMQSDTVVSVIESTAAGDRRFDLNPSGAHWRGDWSGTDRTSWLRRVLKEAGADGHVIDAIATY